MHWRHVAILVTALVIMHDVYMASMGHTVEAAGTDAAGVNDRQSHGPRHAAVPGLGEERPAPGPMAAHCDPVRVVAPLNRDVSPSFDTVLTTAPPDSTILLLFASTSRAIVEGPPPHPPDLDRAFFQVYRL